MLKESGISNALLPEPEEVIRAKEVLKKATKRIAGRFETGLLWKDDDTEFTDIYPIAAKWLMCFEKHLMKDLELYD